MILRVIFEGCKKWPLKTQGGTLTLEFFRMLKFDDFIMYSSYTTKIYITSMASSARNSIVEKLAFLGPRVPPWGSFFRLFQFFIILCSFVFFVMRTPCGLRIYSFFGKFWQKNFFDPRVPPWGVNFSMVKIFSNFVFFVMRTPYKLRIYSLFAKFRQKFFST